MNSNIFRLYDVRGKYPEDLDEEVSYKIGTYFGAQANGGNVLVGYDGRLSSKAMFEALMRGITDAGGNALTIGLVTTPVLYYMDKVLAPKASIMITASHSPKNHNGFKMLLAGKPFFGDKLNELQAYVKSDIKHVTKTQQNLWKDAGSIDGYFDKILENIRINPDFKIVWDSGNGVAGGVVNSLLKLLPNKNIHINSVVDGNFPNRPPDQMVIGALSSLISKVVEEKYDLGISFDGDGDRVVFVTSSGKVLGNDSMLCIFAEEILIENPGALMIADVKTSQTFFDYVEKLGGKTIMSKTGHAFIKDLIAKTGALFAGELSGHIFFADKYYGYDDGLYAALRMINLLTRKDISLDTICKTLPTSFATGEIKIHIKDEEKFFIIEEVKAKMREMGREFIDTDGIRYTTLDGWWLLRASNTESVLMARCESMSPEGLEVIKEDLLKFIPLGQSPA